jgi:hypothetical protein
VQLSESVRQLASLHEELILANDRSDKHELQEATLVKSEGRFDKFHGSELACVRRSNGESAAHEHLDETSEAVAATAPSLTACLAPSPAAAPVTAFSTASEFTAPATDSGAASADGHAAAAVGGAALLRGRRTDPT